MATIAQEIISQLGGNRFSVMTGAKLFVDLGKGVRFRIGSNPSRSNMVEILLAPNDTYVMRFLKKPYEVNIVKLLEKCIAKGLDYHAELKRKEEIKTLAEFRGLYSYELRAKFTEFTKMYLSL